MRKMRRSDRETTAEKAWEILENAEYMTLSMMGAEGVPYGVTLSFARVENALYFHCANEGYKPVSYTHLDVYKRQVPM